MQASLSLHPVPLGLATAEQVPLAGLQVPTLHWSSCALQFTGVPGLQASVAVSHVSTPVQAFPSEQSAFLVHPHPDGSVVHWAALLLQPSTVHVIPSLHTRAGPPQVPLVQVSGVVQNFPSSHVEPFAFVGFEHRPVVMLQVPAV